LPAFAGYFDAAGSESNSDVIVACGALSFTGDWARFDREWSAVMAAEGVRSFHMKDFAAFKPPFDGWRDNEPRRREFLGSLIRLTNETVFRLYVTTLVLSDYRRVNAEFRMTEHFANPYAWAMANCLFHTFDWLLGDEEPPPGDPQRPVSPEDGIAFFVEKGDTGQGGLRQLMTALGWTDREYDETIQVIPKRLGEEDLTPFHVADFVAYEYRSEHRYFVENRRTKPTPRGALKAIRSELYPRVGVVTAEMMRQACIENNVPPR
jgi:hypothetical protein